MSNLFTAVSVEQQETVAGGSETNANVAVFFAKDSNVQIQQANISRSPNARIRQRQRLFY